MITASRATIFNLSAIRFVRAAISAFTVLISARIFGVSIARDLLVLSLAIITIIPLIVYGPINEIFRSHFVFTKEKFGISAAISTTNTLTFFIVLILSFFSAIIFLFPFIVTKIMAPNIPYSQVEALTMMTNIVIPLILINFLSQIWSSVLNALNKIYLQEIAFVFFGLLGLASIPFTSDRYGIYSLIIALYISSTFSTIFSFVYITNELGSNWFCKFSKFNGITKILYSATPFYLTYLLGQTVTIIEKRFCSNLGIGMLSILDYSQRIIALPASVLSSIAISAISPVLSKLFITKQDENFITELIKHLRITFLAITPLISIIIIGNKDIIKILFGTKTSEFDTTTFGMLLSILSIGLLGVTIYSIAGQALISKNNGKIYALISMINQICIALIIIFTANSFGVLSITSAWSLSHTIAGIIMLFFVDRKIYKLSNLLPLITIFAIQIFVSYIFARTFKFSTPYISLIIHSFFVLICHILLCHAFKVNEFNILYARLLKQFNLLNVIQK